MGTLLTAEHLVPALVILAYFGIMALIAFFGHRYLKNSAEDYFLGGRGTRALVLLFTMAATNFSAFTIFGVSGTAYRAGFSFYPLMAFGTGFMALTFYFLGRRIWELGKKKGYMTPPELVGEEMKSRSLRLLFLIVMVVFSLPYIAIQPIAGGYALESLLGIPYFWGATLISVIILFYTWFGGFRVVAWTDVAQGAIMLAVMILAVFGVASAHGGFEAANLAVFDQLPELFSRPGVGGAYVPLFWFSYMILWFFCDPLFPQLFQRFFAAKDKKAINKTFIFYPIVTAVFFLLPVMLGVLGHLDFQGLEGKEADKIFPLLMNFHFSPGVAAFMITAGLAALMSTMDSQLLTLSSMFTRDVYEPLTGKPVKNNRVGKAFTVVLALLGLTIAYFNPSSIVELTTETFTGLAVLFPVTVAVLYWKQTTVFASIASIVVGEVLVGLYHFGVLSSAPMLSVIPILVVSTLTLIVFSFFGKEVSRDLPKLSWKDAAWSLPFIALFALSMDFWNWNLTPTLWVGIPVWVWSSFGLCVLLSGAFYALVRFNKE